MMRWWCTVNRTLQWLVCMLLCLRARLCCKVISKLVAFTRQVHKSKDEWGTCQETLTVFKYANNLRPFYSPFTLQIVKERENITLDDDSLLRYTTSKALLMIFNGKLNRC